MAYSNANRPGAASRQPLTYGDLERMKALYDQGLTDLEIAREVGCASKTVGRWRAREELPRNDRDKAWNS